jgi:hypothetical protein
MNIQEILEKHKEPPEIWPTKDALTKPPPVKHQDNTCGTCIKCQSELHSAKFGRCQWNGQMVQKTQTCPKYIMRKKDAW